MHFPTFLQTLIFYFYHVSSVKPFPFRNKFETSFKFYSESFYFSDEKFVFNIEKFHVNKISENKDETLHVGQNHQICIKLKLFIENIQSNQLKSNL